MKKLLCVLLAAIMLFGLAACGETPGSTQPIEDSKATESPTATTPAENEGVETEATEVETEATEVETEATEVETEATKVETEATEIPTGESVEPTSQRSSYSVYIPNDNANGFVVETVDAEDISAETVLTQLKSRNVLPEAVCVNSFRIDNGSITMDFNQAFADVVCSMGTSGELMIVGSVVNTFLDAFQAESVYFTVDGQVLESGHVIYDFALTFFNIEP